DRVFGNVQADYQITSDLTASVTYALDQLNEDRSNQIPYSESQNSNGIFGVQNIGQTENNFSADLTYNKYFQDFSLRASVGGNSMYQSSSIHTTASDRGGLVVPGLFTLENILPDNLEYSNYRSEKAIYSLYGM